MSDKKPGDPNCKHKWIYSNIVVATFPPTYHKICMKCGRVEHEQHEATEEKDYFYYYKKFHKK